MRDVDQAEIRLMGLILTQAVSIGIAIAVFDAEYWLKLDDPTVNGITYAMAAFAVQGVASIFSKCSSNKVWMKEQDWLHRKNRGKRGTEAWR